MSKKRLLITIVIILIVIGTGIFIGKKNNDNDKTFKIGLAQIVEHPSLNLIRDSFLNEMEALGYKKGENIEYLIDSANGEVNALATIMQKYRSNNVNAIVPIATPTALSAAQYSKDIPVIFSAVSDPIGAGLTTNLDKPDKNITGTSDEIQTSLILDLILKTYPNTKKIGLIYNASEDNSVSTIKKFKNDCIGHGIECYEVTIANTSELSQAANTILEKNDVIFSPIDNTVAAGIDAVANAAMKAKKPFFVAADSMVKGNGFATVGIDYEELGRNTARMLDKVLKGEKVENIPIKIFKDGLNIYINEGVAEKIGFVVPDDIKNQKNYKPISLKENKWL